MASLFSAIVPIVLLTVLFRMLFLPIRLIWKFLIHSVCGFLCLWMVNSLAVYTGAVIPVNLVTAGVAGFLGLPGILLLVGVQLLL